MNYSLKTNIFLLCLSLILPIQITPLGDAEINQTEVDQYKNGGTKANQREQDAKIGLLDRLINKNNARNRYKNAKEAQRQINEEAKENQRQQDLKNDPEKYTKFINMGKDGSWWEKWRNSDMIAAARRVQEQKNTVTERQRLLIEVLQKKLINNTKELVEKLKNNKYEITDADRTNIASLKERLNTFINNIPLDTIRLMTSDDIKNIFLFVDQVTPEQKTALYSALSFAKDLSYEKAPDLTQDIAKINPDSILLKMIIHERITSVYDTFKDSEYDYTKNSNNLRKILEFQDMIKSADLKDLTYLKNTYTKKNQPILADAVQKVINTKYPSGYLS